MSNCLLSLRHFSKILSKQVTRCVDCFVFKLIRNCYQTNNPRCLLLNGYVVEFGEFPKDHLIKSSHLIVCILLK